MPQSVCGVDASASAAQPLGTPIGKNGSTRALASRTPGRGGKEKLDRFIPARCGLERDACCLEPSKENECSSETTPQKEGYKQMLAASLHVGETSRVLAFKHKAPAPPEGHEPGLATLYSTNRGQAPCRKQFRHVPQTQERILDAPDLVDDYYLNLLDWSASNQIAIALGPAVYLFNVATNSIDELCCCPNEGDYISSLQWAPDSTHLAIGTSDSKVQIWDVARAKQVRELAGHTNRVSALAWNGPILSSGGRDSLICNWDVRKRRHEACVAELRGHEQEVCGLAWSSGGQLASGGNDNLLCIWSAGFQQQHRLTAHQAAVKALAWCPFQTNVLASGGGTADRCIKFWNTHTGALLNSIDTGSQVCALQWNRHEREIVSSHGYSKNQLCLWKYPSMVKMAELTGHTARVLHMASSPDGASVVTAGADETLRFWRTFGEPCGKSGDKLQQMAAAAANSSNTLRSAGIR